MKSSERIKLVFPDESFRDAVRDFIEEHAKSGEATIHGSGGLTRMSFDEWLVKVRGDLARTKNAPERVAATAFLGVIENDGRVIGTIQLRHELNDHLLNYGGHIGYGVRPSERRKGYGGQMLELALQEARKLGLSRVLLTCDKDNPASAWTIMSSGGMLEDERVEDNGNIYQRYWIELE